MASNQYFSIREAAKRVGCHRDTILRWIDKGSVKIRKKKNRQGHYIFTASDIEKLRAFSNAIRIVG